MKKTVSTVSADEIEETLEALKGVWVPRQYTDKVVVEESTVLVLADAHIPFHDDALLADAFERAQLEHAEAIVWLGDLMDMPTQSHFGNDDPTTYFERERDITEGVIREAAKYVGRQYWSRGNHEERLFRNVGKQVGMLELARSVGVDDLIRSGELVISDDPTLLHPQGDWMLTHPADYASVPLKVPGMIADLYQRNVISAHAHHFGMGKSPSGKFTAVESGGMFHPGRVAYVNRRVNRMRPWVQGYVLLRNGRVSLYE